MCTRGILSDMCIRHKATGARPKAHGSRQRFSGVYYPASQSSSSIASWPPSFPASITLRYAPKPCALYPFCRQPATRNANPAPRQTSNWARILNTFVAGRLRISDIPVSSAICFRFSSISSIDGAINVNQTLYVLSRW